MQELNNAITERMNHMVNSGKVQELIDKQLENSIKGILESSLREYSKFGEAVKAKLEASLNNAVEKVSFPEYSHFINDQVLALVEQKLNESAVATSKPVWTKYSSQCRRKLNQMNSL